MKKIVITGAMGYIGTELCKIYSGLAKNNEIVAIDKNFYSDRVQRLNSWGIEFKQCDILNTEQLKSILKNSDIVYHLAGITTVPTTLSDKGNNKEIYEVGVLGTRNVLNFVEKNTKIVFPSTHVVFEGLKTVRKNLSENIKPKPILEYAKGKAQSEEDIIASKNNYIILRLGSVYGISSDSTRLNIMPNLFSKITSRWHD